MLPHSAPSAVNCQRGEREADLETALRHGSAAVAELGLTARLEPLPRERPGAWWCTLERDGVPVPQGYGAGKGEEPAARVGAVFEALEHHLCGTLPPPAQLVLRRPRQLAEGPLGGEAVMTALADGPDLPLACLPYRPLGDGDPTDVPLFYNVPGYISASAHRRGALGDHYPYEAAGRYSMNNGWAAGATVTDALVHALNEINERDAMSLLLARQFLTPRPAPLRVVDPNTLPADLAALHQDAEDRVAGPVSLLEMTTDLSIPAYWAYTPAPPAAAARLRGAGSSLSAHYAAERALSELVQIHSVLTARPGTVRRPKACTEKYPALHRCHLADFSTRLSSARTVPFTDTPSPATPAEHLTRLLERFRACGMAAWAREHHVTGHLAVVNVLVPGAERFVLVTDGTPVLPGRRALNARGTGRPCADRRTT
ncbi:YcaO-like family protein [Streptomyces lomondensis]|uniref:YcaO domain-containing protein n=1 Tax=Streptomyces lomondensis TaxID=68229 RepID=A0ABQ2XJ47_9ACTN|nr:YcaO-like family protein [Streptomyces lomondensis]MCF0079574.1 YcaO-like family protein [Streptomyces lomondensis]GGX18946.1 hypothetical protein GCM10010383_56200 [Streptomyces lomondensis]